MEIGRSIQHLISGQDEKKSGSELKPGQDIWNELIEPDLKRSMLMSQSQKGHGGASFSHGQNSPIDDIKKQYMKIYIIYFYIIFRKIGISKKK
jgi:hypothetical protein